MDLIRRKLAVCTVLFLTFIPGVNFAQVIVTGISDGQQFCEGDPAITISAANPGTKEWFGPGITDAVANDGEAVFDPAAAGPGTHNITYDSPARVTISVSVSSFPATTLDPQPSVCEDAASFALSGGNPAGGTYSGPGVDGSGNFDPAAAGPGNHTISYTNSVGTCVSTDSETLTVFALPIVTLSALPDQCVDGDPLTLDQGSPAGGTYSGTGVSGGAFYPATTGTGTYTITYTYNDGNCTNSTTGDISVNPLPIVSFSGLNATYCQVDPADILTGSPTDANGVFTGTGISDNGDGTALFDPGISGNGNYTITYTYTDATGCVNSTTQSTTVGTPLTLTGLDPQYCVDATTATLVATPTGGSYTALAGLTDNGDGTASFDPSTAGVGNYSVEYSYNDGTCTNSLSQALEVLALPTPAFAGLAASYCKNDASVTLTGNYAPGGTFSGPGITDNGDGTATFDPSSLAVGGPYQITYAYTNADGCSESVSKQTNVAAIPTATISGNATICEGSNTPITVSLTGATPFDFTYTTGTIDTDVSGHGTLTYSTNVSPVSTTTYTVTSVTDGNGCSNTGSGSATITVNPQVAITSQPVAKDMCTGNNTSFSVTATGVSLTYQWQKDGVNIAGATNPTLSINDVDATDVAAYQCIVSSTCGGPLISNAASLTLKSPTAISAHPADQLLCTGEDLILEVTATAENIAYQWRKDGVDIAGETTATLSISSVTTAETGSYTCVVTGDCGTEESNAASVEVNTPTTITSQPTSKTVCPGDNTSFIVTATGTDLSYQWRKNGVDIAGATSQSLVLNGVSAGDAGNYRCLISLPCGESILSSTATLTLLTQTQISTNPVNALICTGDNASFEVTAQGTSLSYQWLKDGVAIADGVVISGSTTNTLTLTGATLADAGSYTCRVSGTCGTEESNPATLTVDDAITITTQPASKTACPGSNISFEVDASGSNLSYQWQKNGVDIAGATNDVLSISGVVAGDAGNYRCVLSSSCGATLNSNSASLTVNTTTSISSQPSDAIECEGDNLTLTVNASGTSLTYQWYKGGVALADGGNISGSTTNTLSISNLAVTDAGSYHSEVSGACGTVISDQADVIVDDAITVSSQPEDVTACAGNNVSFDVVASGSNLSYQWQKDGVDIAGATSNVYALFSIDATDEGSYRCIITNSCGSVINTQAADLALFTNTSITAQPADATVCNGGNASFSVTTLGSNLSYQWQKDGVDLTNGGTVSGAQTSSLNITGVSSGDAGVYTCVVTGSCGTVNSSPANLAILENTAITQHPANQSICEGNNAVFTVDATGSNLTYQWQKDGVNIPGATSSGFTINNVAVADEGVFRCIVSGDCGSSNSNGALLTVNEDIIISTQPQNETVCENQAAGFSVAVTGTAPAYQWKLNGSDLTDGGSITGANTANLVIDPATLAHEGTISCVITGTCSSETSTTVNLTVNEEVAITTHPTNKISCPGNDVLFSVSATGTNLTYQWQKNGVNLPGEISSGLLLNNVTSADAAVYRCQVSGDCGTIFSNGASLTIREDVSITANPLDKVVCENNSVGFTVTATGTNLSYQWKVDGANLSDGGAISGANTPNLNIDPVDMSNAGSYVCEISGTCGTVNSIPASLTVEEAVVITTNPQPKTACPGDDILFSVTATGTNLSYQWQKNSVDIPGENNSGLLLSSVSAADAATYRCEVTGNCGSQISTGAMLTINDNAVITLQPVDEEVCEGSSAGFVVNATGTGISYQWKRNNIALADGGAISGVNTANLDIDPLALSNEGVYTCEVTGSCGSANSNPANLLVNETTQIVTHPQNVTACPGENAGFSVSASGDNLTYQWQKDGVDIPGENSTVLNFSGVALVDEGVYRCIVTGDCGTSVSNGATLTVDDALSITAQPAANPILCEGDNLSLSIAATGTTLSYQWYKDGIALANSGTISGAQTDNLIISPTNTSDDGIYTCTVSGTCGSVSSTLSDVVIHPTTTVVTHPVSYTTVQNGDAEFSVQAEGDNLTYQWQKDGANLTDGGGITGSISSVLTLTGVVEIDEGAYRVVIGGTCGTAISNPANLVVNPTTVITTQPADVIRCAGQSASFTLVTSGSGHTYQWRKDGVDLTDNINITGSTTANLTIDAVSTSDAGTYTCQINSENSAPATLTVNEYPAITRHPASISRCEGDAAIFSIEATGTALSYRWQKDGVDLADGGSISGSNTAVLSISATTASDAGSYRCVVTGICGTANSNTASLGININTSITAQPVGATICQSSSYTFSISTTGTNLTYQWYKDGSPLSDGGTVSGSNTPDLTISSANTTDAGAYNCMVSGTCGNENSLMAVLDVEATTNITLQPVNTSACVGENISFEVLAEGEGLSYQWQKDGVNLSDGGTISGSTTASLIISGISLSDDGSYSCIVTGSCGTQISNPADLLVYETTSITLQPTDVIACEGQTVGLSIAADGDNLSYQWRKDGSILADGGHISGTSTTTLTLSGALQSDNGSYTCEITGECGTVTSLPANVEVREPAIISADPLNAWGCEGDNVSFNIVATGHGLSYQWQKEGVNLTDGGSISGTNTNSLSIAGITSADNGSYRCVVSGSCNNVTSNTAALSVYTTTTITTQPAGTLVCEGNSVNLSVTATGDSLTYQWMKNGTPVADGGNISGSTTTNLSIANAMLSNAGIYTIEVGGKCGTENSNIAEIAVDSLTRILLQPTNANACTGDNVSFSVSATGTNLSYQWQKDGSNLANGGNISGANSAVLTLSSTTIADNGAYRCIVSGDCNTVNSNVAYLENYDNTLITSQPSDIAVCEGPQISLSVSAEGDLLTYQWKKDGVALIDGGNITGSSTPTLIINASTTANSGVYTCLVTGACGTENSNPVNVEVTPATLIATQPANKTSCEGDVAVFHVEATGDNLTYAWEKDGSPLTDGGSIFGVNTASLTINTVTTADAGIYRCVVTGTCGSVNSDGAELIVNAYPASAGIISGTSSVCQGDSAVVFEIAAIPNTNTYVWELPLGVEVLSGNGTRAIEVKFTVNETGGNFYVYGQNTCGNGTKSPAHNVVAHPIPAAQAGTDQAICTDNTLLNADNPGTATGSWSVLDGPAIVANPSLNTSSVSNLRIGTNTLIWTVEENGCVAEDRVDINNNSVSAEAGINQTICTESITMSANSPLGGATGGWSVRSGAAGFTAGDDPNTTASDFAPGINVLQWTVTNGTCSVFDTVLIDNQAPSQAYAGIDQSLCKDSTTLAGSIPSIGTGNWSVITGSATFADPSQANTTVNGLAKGSNILRWTVSNGICSSIDEVTINNNQVAVNAGTDQVICDRTTTLAATEPTTGTGNWSVIQGSAAFVNNNLYNTTVTGLAKGENILAWNIENNGCISSDEVSLVNDSPTDADAGDDQTITADFTTLQGNIPVEGSGSWSLMAGSANIADPSLYNTSVTSLALGENTFRWTITKNSCTSWDEVIINNFTPTDTYAGEDQTVCATNTTLNANEPSFGFGEWSVVQGSATFSDESSPNTTVSGLAPGDNILRWTVWQNGFSYDDVVITNDLPTSANAGENQTLCSDVTTLAGNDPIIGKGKWTVVSGAGSFADDTLYNTSIASMARGENIYKWTITNKSCIVSDVVSVTNDLPTIAAAGIDQVICTNNTTLQPNTPSVGTGSWSVIGGSAVFSGNVASNLASGSNTFRWTITNNACSSTDDVQVVNNKPSNAQAGGDKTICADSIKLNASNPAIGTGTWTIQNGSGTISDITNPTADVRNLNRGINVLRWTVEYNGCTSMDEVVITNSLVVASVGPDQALCSSTTLLEANNPPAGEGLWTILGGSGSATFDDSSQPDTRVSGLDRGENILRWTITNGLCESSADVVITNNLPTVAYAGPDQALCQDYITLQAEDPAVGTGEWSILSGSGVITDEQSATSDISDLSYGTNTLRWTVSNEGCTSTDEVVITNNSTVEANAGNDATLCKDSVELFGNNPQFGTGQWSVVSGSATFNDNNNYNTTVRNLGRGTNVLRWMISNGECSSIDEVSITNNSPSKPAAGADQTICGDNTSLSANNPLIGTGKWILVSGAAVFTDENANNTTVSSLNPGNNTLRWQIENKGCRAFDDMIIFNDLPIKADAGQDMEICNTTAAILANDPESGNGSWSVISGSADITNAADFETTVTNLGFGTNTLRWTVHYDECTTTDDIVIVNNQTDIYAGNDQVIGSPETLLAANDPSVGDGQWSVVGGAGTFAEVGSAITEVYSVGPGLNTYRWSIDVNGCISYDDVSVTFNVPPDASFVVTADAGCPPLEVYFVNNSMDDLPFTWNFDDGNTSSEISVKHTYTEPGIYKPSLTIIGDAGEVIIKDTTITVYNEPELSFLTANHEVYIPEEEAVFINNSSYASRYLWEFGDGETSEEHDPRHRYVTPGDYEIILHGWTDNNCYDSIKVANSVLVRESGSIKFPNAFTPNLHASSGGAYNPNDFSNDVFFPIGDGVDTYHLEIFNKWGLLVFESRDMNVGWDGYYQGKLTEEGVYVWKVSGKYNNGKAYQEVGTVLLIR